MEPVARPTVSIVTSLYNKASYIAAAAKSVLAQDFDSFEWVIVDDGSTDGSADRLPDDPRIRVIRQENAGMAAAVNRAVAEARGEFVTFLDADDALLPGKLSKQVAIARAHPDADWVLSGFQSRSADGVRTRLPLGDDVPAGTVRAFDDAHVALELGGQRLDALLLRREDFDVVGGLIHEATPFDHAHFFARLFLARPHCVVHQGAVSLYDLEVPGSLYKQAMKRVEGCRMISELHRALARRYPHHRRSLLRQAERSFCQYARGMALNGHRATALLELGLRYRGVRRAPFLAALGRVLTPELLADALKASMTLLRGLSVGEPAAARPIPATAAAAPAQLGA